MGPNLAPNEALPGEEELAAIPYKPFSVLIVTNKRVIGKQLIRLGFTTFKGNLLMEDIVDVEFKPPIPFLTTPTILLHYRKKDATTGVYKIRFPGFTARLAGFDAEAVYRLIKAQLGRPQVSNAS